MKKIKPFSVKPAYILIISNLSLIVICILTTHLSSLISPLPSAAEEGGKGILCYLKHIRAEEQILKVVSLNIKERNFGNKLYTTSNKKLVEKSIEGENPGYLA